MVEKVTDKTGILDSEGRYVFRHNIYEGCTFKDNGELVAIFSNPVTQEGGRRLIASEKSLAWIIEEDIQVLTNTTKGCFPPQLARDIADGIGANLHALNKMQEIKIKRDIPLETRRVDPNEKKVWENFSYCANDEIYEP